MRIHKVRSMIAQLRRYSRIAVVLLGVWTGAVARWIFGTASGLLVSLLITYILFNRYGPVQPLSTSQLLLWFSQQSEAVQLGFGGLLLTVVGFLVAVWTASATWTRQRVLDLRLEAARAIHERFSVAYRHLLKMNAYMHVLLPAIESARRLHPQNDEDARAHLAFANSQSEVFKKNRQDLYEAMYEIYDLYGAYATTFHNVVGVQRHLELAAKALESGQQVYAKIFPPYVDINHPQFVERFLSQCDDAAFSDAYKTAESAHLEATALSGLVTGQLTSKVLRPNMFAIASFTSSIRNVSQAVDLIAKGRQRGNKG